RGEVRTRSPRVPRSRRHREAGSRRRRRSASGLLRPPGRQGRRGETGPAVMSAPVCRTVEEAYQAGRRDAAAELVPTAELADRVAALLAPWLEAIATSRVPRLLTMTQAAEQLGMSRTKF